ncbi:MAG: hypothetical protein EAZ27_02615 [Cytophagales bacterium]|nr:MAG: hypothetical protein EAZ27_02615 [Cytophagales bacterium]
MRKPRDQTESFVKGDNNQYIGNNIHTINEIKLIDKLNALLNSKDDIIDMLKNQINFLLEKITKLEK